MIDNELFLFESEGKRLEKSATQLIIHDAQSYEVATMLHQAIKTGIKKIQDYFKPKKKEKELAYQEEIDKEKACLAPYKRAEALLTKQRSLYDEEQQRKPKTKVRASKGC